MSKSGSPVKLQTVSDVDTFQNASNAIQTTRTDHRLTHSFHWKVSSFHRKAAAARIAARKAPGTVKNAAPLDGTDVVCEAVAADWDELAELEDALELLVLVDSELEDVDAEDVSLADVELADVELAEEPEADDEEALPVLVATKPVWVPVAP
jgi:hypothetical protein